MASKKLFWSCVALLLSTTMGRGAVVINEVFLNPPGSLDETREFIELLGTPGMKLDGYAIALANGGLQRLFPIGTIPPIPPDIAEIDELFSLDGLQLGDNGLLVVAVAASFNYPQLLSDTAFRGNWASIWNGGLDTPGQLQNDGSNTIYLLRNRPGQTQADPFHPLGLVWGKHRFPDAELITPVIDPQDGIEKDQWGDGDLDEGQPNGIGGVTLDFPGAQTPEDLTDDLEIVDEVSYEHERGWEFDIDGREVDISSESNGLPPRRVHALDDPQGFNPDCLSRVDYRTSGPGWPPAPGAFGELPNGNNWQDTATEQWVRGESVVQVTPQGPEFYYNNGPNDNPDSIQPYATNVPTWLADGVAPDYDFGMLRTYQITAGRVNPLAVPLIPGDADRDGDADADDIAKVAAVFGDADWIFSNAHDFAPEGKSNDPAAQTRPWDVDATGDNGIESSDLQWTLNFQGDTTGRIVGVRYDSPTPAASGVVLNPNTDTWCSIEVTAAALSGRPLNSLLVGDVIQVAVTGHVLEGANDTPGEHNGIMQFVHDLLIAEPGIARFDELLIEPPYQVTRQSLIQSTGSDGDLGVQAINGFTTSFDQGLQAPVVLYRVYLDVVAAGTTTLQVVPATHQRLSAAAPAGVKLGHTAGNGDPETASYSPGIEITATLPAAGNCDADPLVTLGDYACFLDCVSGPQQPAGPACGLFDLDGDDDVDAVDFAGMQTIFGK